MSSKSFLLVLKILRTVSPKILSKPVKLIVKLNTFRNNMFTSLQVKLISTFSLLLIAAL